MSDSAAPEFSQAGNIFEQPGSIELATADATREFGAQLGATLGAGDVVILSGGLGAGKTTLTQGIAKGMDVRGRVTSPTFTIARVHRARRADAPDLVHVDEWGAGLVEALTRRYLLVELDRETLAEQDPESETRIITWRWNITGKPRS